MDNVNNPIGSGTIKTDADGLVKTTSLLAAEINVLPTRVKQYIHDLETNADPAGTIQDLASTKEQLAGTIVLLDEAKERGDVGWEKADDLDTRIEHLEGLLAKVWDFARDHNLSMDARVDKIMATIREKP